MSLERKEIFEFGEFRLDVDEHTIERIDGQKNAALTGKAFQTLVLLVSRRGHLVSREDLIRYIWPDTIVEDNNLEKCVHHLRQYLGETANGHKYIETVRKHGYRFVKKVETVEVSSSWLPESLRAVNEDNPPASLPDDGSIHPAANMKSSFGVEQLVVDRAGTTFRSILFLPSLILLSVGIITAVGYYRYFRLGLQPASVEFQSKRGTENEEAKGLYLQAMNLSEERGVQNLQKALEYLDRAVLLDPNYSVAWAGKALIHRDIVGHTDSGQREHYEKSMDALGNALAIDPNSSEAYSALCGNKQRYEYDTAGAEAACQQALALDPNSPVAHKTYANFLYSIGRFDEAIVEIKKAMDLQPVSYRNQQMYALTLYYARRYGEAEELFKRLIELNPGHGAFIYDRLIRVLEAEEKYSEAYDSLVKKLTLEKADVKKIERLTAAYRSSGWRGVVIEQIKTAEADSNVSEYQLACLYAKAADKDKAFENLEKAYQTRSFQIAILKVDPELDALRSDPRYADLVRRVEGK